MADQTLQAALLALPDVVSSFNQQGGADWAGLLPCLAIGKVPVDLQLGLTPSLVSAIDRLCGYSDCCAATALSDGGCHGSAMHAHAVGLTAVPCPQFTPLVNAVQQSQQSQQQILTSAVSDSFTITSQAKLTPLPCQSHPRSDDGGVAVPYAAVTLCAGSSSPGMRCRPQSLPGGSGLSHASTTSFPAVSLPQPHELNNGRGLHLLLGRADKEGQLPWKSHGPLLLDSSLQWGSSHSTGMLDKYMSLEALEQALADMSEAMPPVKSFSCCGTYNLADSCSDAHRSLCPSQHPVDGPVHLETYAPRHASSTWADGAASAAVLPCQFLREPDPVRLPTRVPPQTRRLPLQPGSVIFNSPRLPLRARTADVPLAVHGRHDFMQKEAGLQHAAHGSSNFSICSSNVGDPMHVLDGMDDAVNCFANGDSGGDNAAWADAISSNGINPLIFDEYPLSGGTDFKTSGVHGLSGNGSCYLVHPMAALRAPAVPTPVAAGQLSLPTYLERVSECFMGAVMPAPSADGLMAVPPACPPEMHQPGAAGGVTEKELIVLPAGPLVAPAAPVSGPHVCRAGLAKLQQYFDMPIQQAAVKLRMSLSTLKKVSRAAGLLRWPHRKLLSLHKLLHKIQVNSDFTAAERQELSNRVRRNVADVMADPDTPIADELVSARQAWYKRVYEVRRPSGRRGAAKSRAHNARLCSVSSHSDTSGEESYEEDN